MASKISVYSVPDLKNTSDDALPNYLTSLKFKQSHIYTDVRLALGYTAVVISGVLFYADWKLGWDKTKFWTLWAVLAYFAINTALTYWIWFVENGITFVGERNGVKLVISTSTKKHDPIYNVTARYTVKDGSKFVEKEVKAKAPFTRWFTADGYFVAKPFQQFLASEISAIGEADPSNVVEEIGRGSSHEGGAKDIDAQLYKLAGFVDQQGQGGSKVRRRG
ncbi:hypothetical protein EJ06DRAFT_556697 [Trichodelitschia bisporula]|uniref:Signal peptidase complex subunit 2 n=1 Tax=Trichodelitschia bisporula TaxID=703511 RepID=A0A6G1HX36_9PEZI|nr:hypothetical protein EJ06DRAFT_556697 [Trichodelitschia bisporula]